MNHRTRLQAETPTLPRAQASIATAPETKPRKANSEVRKQQNRIASRNYREKRKRKLQQLQQLLEDDQTDEQRTHTRSTSPYDDRSCSGSIGYERSVASASPHIASISGNFSPSLHGHASIARQAWSLPGTPSDQTLANNDPYPGATQLSTIYSQNGLTTTTYPTWMTPPSTASTSYPTLNPSQHYTYTSQSNCWPSTGLDTIYAYAAHEQQAMASSYMSSWQYHANEELPAGVAVDFYGQRYCRYESQ